MRQSEKISLPTFYARQYETKHSASEEILIFRWFQYLEQHRHLYAVKNKHQCFGNNSTTSIVQPFASVDYFFGCLECGKYHLCRSKRDTCEVSIDSRDNQQICRYSGRPLLEQDNLALTFEDTTHFDHEAIQFSTTDTRKTLSRIETHARQKKRKRKSGVSSDDPLVKRRNLIELFKEARDDGSMCTNQHRKKRPRINHLEHMATLFDTDDVYELSIDSLDDDDDDKKEHDIKDGDYDDNGDDNDDDDDEEEEHGKNRHIKENEGDDDDEEEAVANKVNGDGKDDEEGASCMRLGQRDEDGDDEGEWGGAALIDDINGDGRHTKNYHNNIKYRNDYYGFLLGTLAKQKQSRHDVGEQSSIAKKNVFFEMCNRDIREETPSIETTTTVDTTHPVKMSLLSPSICTEIENETRNILTLLIGVNGPHVTKKDSLALLLEKFVPLIENIVLLVYRSPVINRQTLIRDIKNHNQAHNFSLSSSDIANGGGGGGGGNSDDNTNESMRSEQIISPQKMCRALLLHTLTEAFSLHDDYQHRIGIWQPDPWLRRFNCKKTNRVLVRDFFSSHSKRDTLCGGDLPTFRKEIMDTSTLIRESLEFYALCPLWLRYRVFKIRDK